MSLSLSTDRLLIRADGGSTRYLHISLRAPSAPARADRRPLSVAFVLDRSGSMRGQKLALAKRAVHDALDMLRPEDHFSIVAYDDRMDVVVPAMPASVERREVAKQQVERLAARGATDLCTGWLSGCEQVADLASDVTIARTLLLSDGHANRGITNRNEIAGRAAELRRAYVVTSTFGVGSGFDERLMASMADAGGGNFYFIEEAAQIQDMLASELGEALEVVVRLARIHLELPDGVEAEVMHRFRSTQTGTGLQIELDDLVSDQLISVIVKLQFPLGGVDDALQLRARLCSEDERLDESSAITWTFADNPANDAQFRNIDVDRQVAAIEAARARHDAVELNRAGNYVAASGRLVQSVARLSGYAGDDTEMNQLIDSLRTESGQVAQSMDAMAMKRLHYQSSSAMKSREASGRARQDRSSVRFQVQECDGHLFVHMPGSRRFLLATGSSVSLSDDNAIELLGRQFRVAPHTGPVSLDVIRRHVHGSMAGLIGMDILGRFFWTLDVRAGILTMSSSKLEAQGVQVLCGSIAGVPTLPIQADGRDAEAFLDTGAWLSYMPAPEAAGAERTGLQRDFIVFPAPMEFTTDVYERTIRVANTNVTSEFAVLPATVPVAPLARRRWILGGGLLSRRPLTFDPHGGVVTFGDGA
jgi:Ca-activated chloride channel family protein